MSSVIRAHGELPVEQSDLDSKPEPYDSMEDVDYYGMACTAHTVLKRITTPTEGKVRWFSTRTCCDLAWKQADVLRKG